MRFIRDIIVQSLRTLGAHKLRSFLTMFGIAWGVGSLLLLVGVGEGFRSGQSRQMAEFGENPMFLFWGRVPAVEGKDSSRRLYKLTYGDFQAARDESPHVGNISAVIGRGDIRAVSEFNNVAGGVTGVSPVYNQIRTMPLATGRWFNSEDDDQRRQVAVLGNQVPRDLFPGRPAVGSFIVLNGYRFQVIGVLQQIGRQGNGGDNIRVFIPAQTMLLLYPLTGMRERDAISYINYNPRRPDEHMEAREEVHKVIARRHGFDWHVKEAFEEDDSVEDQERIGQIFTAMDWFLGGVGLVTLGLGAIGVVNIMLVAVSERTREIGLCKALGATNRKVLMQFFVEGVFLTLLSGALGTAGAAAFMWILRQLPAMPGFDWPSIVPMSAAIAITALGISGTLAALVPARRAAMLTPVEALRKE